jgi:homoserine O-acetyltransferase/O-succinyltransferase
MKVLIAGVLGLCSVAAGAQDAAAPKGPEPVERAYVIHNFKTESGVVLPEAKVVYGTYGKLDAAGDNAILLPSHTWRRCMGMDG